MTFVLKRRSQSSIKTGIAWKVLLKLCLYFRIPFEMYSHCICENWKVHNIWDLLGPLLCTHTYCNLPRFSSQIKFKTAFCIPIQLDKASCSISLVKWEPLTHLTLTTGKSPLENQYQDKYHPTVVLPSLLITISPSTGGSRQARKEVAVTAHPRPGQLCECVQTPVP